MNQNINSYSSLRLHLTNVTGAGATQLLQSLLPALEQNSKINISEIHLPDRGALASYQSSLKNISVKIYRRWLPNALSRFLESLIVSRYFDSNVPLLVLGDLPLRCKTHQTVFVQTPHLSKPEQFHWKLDNIKFAIARQIFRMNAKYADAFIVQTSVMRDSLAASYPDISNRIHVIAQPVPSWLLNTVTRSSGFASNNENKLRLIYPAASYPHKNHKLLAHINADENSSWPVESLQLTIDTMLNPASNMSWIKCVGFLSAPEMIKTYNEVDGLLFLSTQESYGFPLVEAMYVGLPIICPDLPYAHTLCSDDAIYFDPLSIDSLREAINKLQAKLATGWWPDWKEQLASIPKDWDTVANNMIDVACGSKSTV